MNELDSITNLSALSGSSLCISRIVLLVLCVLWPFFVLHAGMPVQIDNFQFISPDIVQKHIPDFLPSAYPIPHGPLTATWKIPQCWWYQYRVIRVCSGFVIQEKGEVDVTVYKAADITDSLRFVIITCFRRHA